MKLEDQIAALAELDGWTVKSRQCPHSGSFQEHFWFSPDDQITPKAACNTYMFPSGNIVGHILGEQVIKSLPPYLTSRDAIVPVILKWCGSDLSKWQKLSDKLFGWPDSETMYVTKAIRELLNRTPDQLCAAVLLAAGKWKEINYE